MTIEFLHPTRWHDRDIADAVSMYLESLAEGEQATMKGSGMFYTNHRNVRSLAVLSHRGGSCLLALAQAGLMKREGDDPAPRPG